MSKQVIHTAKAPAAVGPYSQAVQVPSGKMVFLSGQIGLVPASGEMISEKFEDQVKQAFLNRLSFSGDAPFISCKAPKLFIFTIVSVSMLFFLTL
jgi:hypothetical protein